MEDNKKQSNINDHSANERTFLAWVRTSIGIMVFGFVVVKFSLFVKQISSLLDNQNNIVVKEYSTTLGIALVCIGTITTVLSYFRYRQTAKQLNEGSYKHSSLLIILITTLIFLISVLLIVYLVKTTE